ncbi:MAG: hypothetical protein WBD25_07905 [Terriglobales bacterium]|jgi:hypothetical protein
MFQIRFTIFLMLAFSFLLGTVEIGRKKLNWTPDGTNKLPN